MQSSNRWKQFGLGGALVVASLLGAWNVGPGRDRSPQPAPMDQILTEADGAASAVSWDLTVTRNERVDFWIDFLKGRNYERTHLWLERSGRYGPMIQAELRARGMPEDLLYLALIESGFSPYAESHAAAVGIWQFIAETGRRHGLRIDHEVDERRDPVQATAAALDYLEVLYERFDSWYLAAASYNTGENRVDRILRERAGGARGQDELFWEIAPHLPRETRDYVPLMLAAGHIAKEPARYGFHGLEYQEPLGFDEVWVPGNVPVSAVAEAAGVAAEVVEELNPHLLRDRTPRAGGGAVRIPAGTRSTFAAAFPAVYQAARLAVAAEPAYHKVNRGENLTVIARRYGLSLSELRSLNDMGRSSRILAGQRLRVE
ncbi:MAG: transglycosylase SLT domain-containing protein [Gemmatimonadota bacterium]